MTCECGKRKHIDLKPNTPLCADRSHYEHCVFMGFYSAAQLRGLKVWFIMMAMPLKPIIKMPVADYE